MSRRNTTPSRTTPSTRLPHEIDLIGATQWARSHFAIIQGGALQTSRGGPRSGSRWSAEPRPKDSAEEACGIAQDARFLTSMREVAA